MSVEKRIKELGLQLPKVPTPAANYANAVRMGNVIYLSGTVPAKADGTIPKGKVGADVTTSEAAEHARLAGLNILAILKEQLGNLHPVGLDQGQEPAQEEGQSAPPQTAPP